jgi:hypothetical protein
MSAVDTALRVLSWASAERPAPAPTGDLTSAEELASPPEDVAMAAGRLAVCTAARHRLTWPPLGDERVVPGCGVVFAAAAVGGRQQPELADAVLQAAPVATAGPDLVAYHGVVAAALRPSPVAGDLAPLLAGRLRERSPLTGVLDSPTAAGEVRCERLLDRLIAHPEGRQLVVLAFAEPPASQAQLAWRAAALDRLRDDDPGLVLDVYETAAVHFGREHRERARRAVRELRQGDQIDEALGLAAWWAPLAALARSWPERLRRRRHLTRDDYRDGLALHAIARGLQGGLP